MVGTVSISTACPLGICRQDSTVMDTACEVQQALLDERAAVTFP